MNININDKIFNWTIVSDEKIIKSANGENYKFYNLQCQCNKIISIRKDRLKKAYEIGPYKELNINCRECSIINKINLNAELMMSSKVYNHYKRGAKNREIDFNITPEMALYFFKQNCYYCGQEPSNVFLLQRTMVNGKTFTYSGIDRIDSLKGYEEGNMVSCCKWCNFSKNNRDQKDFLEWTERLYNFQVQRLSREGVPASAGKQEIPL